MGVCVCLSGLDLGYVFIKCFPPICSSPCWKKNHTLPRHSFPISLLTHTHSFCVEQPEENVQGGKQERRKKSETELLRTGRKRNTGSIREGKRLSE